MNLLQRITEFFRLILIDPLIRLVTRIHQQNFRVIWQIWMDTYPPSEPKEHTLLEKILMVPPLLVRAFSVSNAIALFPTGSKYAYMFIDLYVLIWAIGLTILLNNISAGFYFVAFIAVYRVLDILGYQMCVILIDSQNPEWRLASLRRSFLSSLVNMYEIVVAFSILYISIGNIAHSSNTDLVISDPATAFYYSLVTMATLGYGEFVPKDLFSRNIVVAQILSELLFLVIFVPIFAANIVTQLQAREFKRLSDADEVRKQNKKP